MAYGPKSSKCGIFGIQGANPLTSLTKFGTKSEVGMVKVD